MRAATATMILGMAFLLVLAYSGKEIASARNGTDPKGSAQAHIEELKAEVKKLHELVPDQAAIMIHVGYHWSNLWFAIDRENWELAEFYLSETRANLKWAVRSKPFRKTKAAEKLDLAAIAEAIDNAQFKEMKNAISNKNRKTCIKLYDDAVQGCYACHKASDKPYLRPRRPTAPEVRVIDFNPIGH